MNNYRLALAAAILSSVLSSFAWVFQGEAVRYLSPFVTACFINLISSGLLFIFLWWRKSLPRFSEILLHKRDLFYVTLLRPVIAGCVFCYALTLTDGLKLMFFTKLEPYFVLFIAWLLDRQRITQYQCILLIVHILGAILLSTDGTLALDMAQYGDLLVIATVALISFAYLPAARLSRALGATKANMTVMVIGGIFLLPFAIVSTPAPFHELPREGWKNLFISLLFFQVFGLSLWYYSLRVVQGWLVSALRATGPIFAAPLAYFYYDQSMSLLQMFGAFLVLLTSALMARGHKKEGAVS